MCGNFLSSELKMQKLSNMDPYNSMWKVLFNVCSICIIQRPSWFWVNDDEFKSSYISKRV